MKLFEWQQEFDGTQLAIDADERGRIGREFHRYVGALLGCVVKLDGYLEDKSQWRKLNPTAINEIDITRFNISYADRRISVPRIYAYRLLSERPRTTLSSTYQPDVNGTICRTDTGGNPQQEIMRGRSSIFTEAVLPEGFTDGEMFDALITVAQKRGDDEAANKQLDRDARLNGQPIGWQELDSLMRTLDTAVPL